MMREVRTIEPQSKSLEGYLEAFTFTGSSTLELEAEVETCLEHCKPVRRISDCLLVHAAIFKLQLTIICVY